MPSFLVDPGRISGGTAVLSGTEAAHMLRVLRLGPGDTFFAFDGTGARYRMRIIETSSRSVRAEVLDTYPPQPPPPVEVTLLVGLPKADKMDFIIEKATELGCGRIVPFRSSRTIPRPGEEEARRRLLRWERVAAAAAKQCGSGRVPEIFALAPYPAALEAASGCEGRIIFYEGEERFGLKALLGRMGGIRSAALLVGPEGGFSADEVREAQARGFARAGLGPRILRVETAALAAVAMVMYHFENP